MSDKVDLIDTHCHIHEAQYELAGDNGVRNKWLREGKPDPDNMIRTAREAGVTKMICVGTTVADSILSTKFVENRDFVWASIGIHPHEAADQLDNQKLSLEQFAKLARKPKVVAIGECGLDYFYNHSPRDKQIEILKYQIELAIKNNLPLIFHVREAFEDFWPIFDGYKDLKGVIHSFSATKKELDQILKRNLYVGLNGIMTFTKKSEQLEAAKAVPNDKLILETDAPFLTPAPFRGTICEPKHVRITAGFLAELRGESLEELASYTTANAHRLFGLS